MRNRATNQKQNSTSKIKRLYSKLSRRLVIATASALIALAAPLLPLGSQAKGSAATIFPSTTPQASTANDPHGVELGVKFTSDVDGNITGIRFYKGSTTNGGTHYGHLWSASGTQLAQAQFANETSTGWQDVTFTTPVHITANTRYVASYYAPQGNYSYTANGLQSAHDNPPLHTVANSVSPDGIYLYTGTPTGGFPTSAYQATNYWVDVDFTPDGVTQPPADITAPTVSVSSPSNNQTVSGTVQVSANASDNVAVASVQFYLDGQPLGSAITNAPYTTSWNTTAATNGSHIVTAKATDTSNNQTTSSDVTVTVQNTVTPPPTAASIWPTTATPVHIDSNDTSSVSLGVKFTSDTNGYIDGIRFYKGDTANGGTHVGDLWSSDGTLLGEATFTNETNSGWQDVRFNGSVAITAGTTYVASYYAPQGHYPYDSNTDSGSLVNAVDNPPLHALASAASGGNGLFSYGSSASFPSHSFQSSNYWVDVDFSTTFTPPTPVQQPTPRPGVRGSGPVLVLTDPTNAFSDDYCSTLLKTEGLPECAATDTGNLDSSFSLSSYRTIILADSAASLTNSQIALLTTWVQNGGTFIAMRPNDNLDSLLGIGQKVVGSLNDAYYKVDPGAFPGIETQTMQYHGPADEHALAGAQAMATLYSSATTATSYPAIATNTVGNGKAIAYMFDVSKSVLLTRDGNPALAGQVTESTDQHARVADRFGNGWLDTSKAAIPQADELQRSLANLVETSTSLPRLWYFPAYQNGTIKAALIMTGDDHNSNSQTLNRFAAESAASPANCSVADWTCYTSTSYAYANAFSDTAAKPYTDNGFEVSPHIADNSACAANWNTTAQLNTIFNTAYLAWQTSFPSISSAYPPVTERFHCYGIWNDYASVAQVEAAHGITADTNSACWPNQFLNVGQCLFTGTGMPENYIDASGNSISMYQFTTQATDENPTTVAKSAVNTLVTNATGPNAYYGYFTVLCHLDNLAISNQCATDTLSVAQTNNIPMISAKQAAQFWDGRNSATITNPSYSASSLSFTVTTPVANLQVMVPVSYNGKSLNGITLSSNPASYNTQTINGMQYAFVTVPNGSSSVTANYQ